MLSVSLQKNQRNFVAALAFLTFGPLVVHAQLHKRFDLHGVRPGMLTREVILNSHAPLDTMVWGGFDGASILSFKGDFLEDNGEFRVAVQGPEVTQVSFISKKRSAADNAKVLGKVIEKLKKLHGKPTQEYHNVYQSVAWESPGEKFTLTSSDKGQFYSIALINPDPPTVAPPVLIPHPDHPEAHPAEQKR